MKHFFLLPLFILATLANAPVHPKLPSAEELLTKAIRQAKKEKKNVFILFHASWCGPCKLMQKTMQDPTIKSYFPSAYVMLDMTAYEFDESLNNPGASNLLEKHNNGQASVPFWLILDSTGKSLGDAKMKPAGRPNAVAENIGCPVTKEEVAYFTGLLKKTSSLGPDALQAIEKRFRKNDK
jgi:thiol-disulfide isomerase/thioredoxin